VQATQSAEDVTRLNNEGVGGAFPLKEPAPARGRLGPSLGAVPGFGSGTALQHASLKTVPPFSPDLSECLWKVGYEATEFDFSSWNRVEPLIV
jgi:hypothetical protein